MALQLKTNGTTVPLPDYKLVTLQGAVGGYIEPVYLLRPVVVNDSRFHVMLVNEEGLILHLPENKKASDLLLAAGRTHVASRGAIVGDVVLMTDEEWCTDQEE